VQKKLIFQKSRSGCNYLFGLKLLLSNLIIVNEATNSTQFRKEAATRAQSQSLAKKKSQVQQSVEG